MTTSERMSVAQAVLLALEGDRDAVAAAAPVAGWTPRQIVQAAAWLRAQGALGHEGRKNFRRAAGAVGGAFGWVSGVVSLQRNGYAREDAVRAMSAAAVPSSVPFVLLRLDDIVPAIREQAAATIGGWLRPGFAPDFARHLVLFELLGGRQRGQAASVLRAIRAWLVEPGQRAALVEATSDVDPLARRAAYRLAWPDEPAMVGDALVDPSPQVRVWAARQVVSTRMPTETRRALLPLLRASRSARLRQMALRSGAGELSTEELEGGLFDVHSLVRLEARVRLLARDPDRPPERTRGQARAIASDPASPADRLIGAIGTLAEVGTADDVGLVSGLVSDPRPRVRREAARTLGMLGR